MKCEKANVACEGYVREHRFVDEAAKIAKHGRKVKAGGTPVNNVSTFISRLSTESPSLSLSAAVIKYLDPTLPDKTQPSEVDFQLPDGIQNYGWDLRVGRQLQMKVDENAHIAFLLANLFSGFPSIFWLYEQATDYTSTSALPSVRALAATYFGRRHHSTEAIRKGIQLYGQALKGLNEDLLSNDRADSVVVLRSAVTLELYEVRLYAATLTHMLILCFLGYTARGVRFHIRVVETRWRCGAAHRTSRPRKTSTAKRENVLRRKQSYNCSWLSPPAQKMFLGKTWMENGTVGA